MAQAPVSQLSPVSGNRYNYVPDWRGCLISSGFSMSIFWRVNSVVMCPSCFFLSAAFVWQTSRMCSWTHRICKYRGLRRLTDRLIPDDAVLLFIFKAWNPRIARYVRVSTTQQRGKKTSSGGMRLFGNRLKQYLVGFFFVLDIEYPAWFRFDLHNISPLWSWARFYTSSHDLNVDLDDLEQSDHCAWQSLPWPDTGLIMQSGFTGLL